MNVVQAGPEFLRLAQNDIGEKCFASPAISHGHILLRGDKHLFCISNKTFCRVKVYWATWMTNLSESAESLVKAVLNDVGGMSFPVRPS